MIKKLKHCVLQVSNVPEAHFPGQGMQLYVISRSVLKAILFSKFDIQYGKSELGKYASSCVR